MSESSTHSRFLGLSCGVRPALIDLFHSLLPAFTLQRPQSGPLPDRERIGISEGGPGGFQFVEFMDLGDDSREMRRLGAGFGMAFWTLIADLFNILGLDRFAL
jgi:hypothetical protein